MRIQLPCQKYQRPPILVRYIFCFLDSTQGVNVTSLNETIEVLYDNQEITIEASQELVSDDKISNSSSLYLTQAGYYCHEKYEMYLPFLDQAQFWIEGICLTIIAIIGLLGKTFIFLLHLVPA